LSEKLYKVEEVAVLIGCSVPTINYWYRYKKENPEEKLAQLIPEFTQLGTRMTRYWTQKDIYKLVEFRSKLPHGRNGMLGSVTQKYYHKEKGKNNGKKKVNTKRAGT